MAYWKFWGLPEISQNFEAFAQFWVLAHALPALCLSRHWCDLINSDNFEQSCICMCKFFSYTKEALEVNAKLLEANPEYLTARNYRKFAVEHILSHSETDTEIDPDSIKSIYGEELRVVHLSEPLIWKNISISFSVHVFDAVWLLKNCRKRKRNSAEHKVNCAK